MTNKVEHQIVIPENSDGEGIPMVQESMDCSCGGNMPIISSTVARFHLSKGKQHRVRFCYQCEDCGKSRVFRLGFKEYERWKEIFKEELDAKEVRG